MGQKYSPAKQRKKETWFGFTKAQLGSAIPLLWFLSLIGIICLTISLLFMAYGIITALSLYSATNQASQEYGTSTSQNYSQAMAQQIIVVYVIWIFFILFLLGLCIYTFNKMRKMR